jgi:hypothetical protein
VNKNDMHGNHSNAYLPVIQSTHEAERRIVIQGKPMQKVSKTHLKKQAGCDDA